jgi:formiminoglutamase
MLIQSSFHKVEKLTIIRSGETKLGQILNVLKNDVLNQDDLLSILNKQIAKYVLVGIAEDIGIRANYGKAGADKAYDAFLSYFVNIQKNQFLNGENTILLGEIFVGDIQSYSTGESDIEKLRELCAQIDERVYPVIRAIVQSGKTPIIIGGGHNNSYGNIKGTSLALNKKIDILNIDPHADFRIEEGRHSGNGFRYAHSQNYMNKYGVWGLHENYNNQTILDSFSHDLNLTFETFDNILCQSSIKLDDFLTKFSSEIGLELDLDSIKYMPTSAKTPIGFTEEEVIQFVYKISKSKRVLYYHLTEGSPDEMNAYVVGKFLTYMVSTILKIN